MTESFRPWALDITTGVDTAFDLDVGASPL